MQSEQENMLQQKFKLLFRITKVRWLGNANLPPFQYLQKLESVNLIQSFGGSRKRRKKGTGGLSKKLQKKMRKLMDVVIMYEDQVKAARHHFIQIQSF